MWSLDRGSVVTQGVFILFVSEFFIFSKKIDLPSPGAPYFMNTQSFGLEISFLRISCFRVQWVSQLPSNIKNIKIFISSSASVRCFKKVQKSPLWKVTPDICHILTSYLSKNTPWSYISRFTLNTDKSRFWAHYVCKIRCLKIAYCLRNYLSIKSTRAFFVSITHSYATDD